MIPQIQNTCKVCVFSPHLEPTANDARIQETLDELSKMDADVIYIRDNRFNNEKLYELIKRVETLQPLSMVSTGNNFCLITLAKKSRFEGGNIANWDGSFSFHGADVKLQGYKNYLTERETKRVYVVGLAIINITSLPVNKESEGDHLFKHMKLQEWFDSDKEIVQMEKRESHGFYGGGSNCFTYGNLLARVPRKEVVKPKEKGQNLISKLVHKVIDKKPVKAPEPVAEPDPRIDVSTLYCKVSAKGRSNWMNVFDDGERLHQYVYRERNDTTISTADQEHYSS